jgi:hypothetical protein
VTASSTTSTRPRRSWRRNESTPVVVFKALGAERLRLGLFLPQRDLAAAVGIKASPIAYIENGFVAVQLRQLAVHQVGRQCRQGLYAVYAFGDPFCGPSQAIRSVGAECVLAFRSAAWASRFVGGGAALAVPDLKSRMDAAASDATGYAWRAYAVQAVRDQWGRAAASPPGLRPKKGDSN